ncbi:hypothetical protein LIER_01296 [Lithospermum erythrorhizon]|uniref:Uncharacterized protein n=1 Tax=Lithospermum erythrorhizon TaxID=34254 RepID=A0AAV3NKG5_LITER
MGCLSGWLEFAGVHGGEVETEGGGSKMEATYLAGDGVGIRGCIDSCKGRLAELTGRHTLTGTTAGQAYWNRMQGRKKIQEPDALDEEMRG